MKTLIAKRGYLKTLVLTLEFLVLGLVVYLIIAPFYPDIRYHLVKNLNWAGQKSNQEIKAIADQNIVAVIQAGASSTQDDADKNPLINSLKIEKIGVDIPIIESKNEQEGLSKGAWRIPQTSTPEQGGNTVISAHRYKFLPPSSKTFYLLDKLEAGDKIQLVWSGQNYQYKVAVKKIVAPEDINILEPTEKPILTLFTCDPIWSEKNRLVVIGNLIEK